MENEDNKDRTSTPLTAAQKLGILDAAIDLIREARDADELMATELAEFAALLLSIESQEAFAKLHANLTQVRAVGASDMCFDDITGDILAGS